jgi:hypothetical protein
MGPVLLATAGSRRSFSHTSTREMDEYVSQSGRVSDKARFSRVDRTRNRVGLRGRERIACVRFGWKKRGGRIPSGRRR